MTARRRFAALCSVSVLALTALAGCGDDDQDPASADRSPTAASEPTGDAGKEPSASGSAGDEGSDDGSASGKVTVPVYFVGDTAQGKRLYREFRQVDAGDPALAALNLMASGDALDPDYTTLYPAGDGFASVDAGSDLITVGLTDDTWTTAAPGMSDADARLATQQLVYTVQGVLQKRLPVQVQVDGQPADLFGLAGQASNDPELEVRALVNITAPEEGATVTGTFTASGVSSTFEATTPWEIRRGGADGPVVEKGFATAEGAMDKLYPWKTEIDVSDLKPGAYTLVVSTDDPSDGEGAGPTTDTKSITVR